MIELRRLGYLVVLAKRLSYSRAAIDLGLSQSALTRAIQSLEKEIGMRLFDRGQSGVRLTEQGRWVVAKAEVLLTNATDFANQLAFAAKGEEGRIRIGMTATVAHLLLPDALPARITDTPRFSHEVLVRDVEPLYLMLAQGQIEFLICSEPSSIWSIPDVMPVKISSLGKLPIGLVVRDGHPLLDDAEPGGRFPILVASAENRSGHSVAFLLEWIGSSVQIIEDIGIISSLVGQTDAIWLTSPAVVASELALGTLRQLPLPEGIETTTFELFSYSLARRSASAAGAQLQERFSHFIASLATGTAAR